MARTKKAAQGKRKVDGEAAASKKSKKSKKQHQQLAQAESHSSKAADGAAPQKHALAASAKSRDDSPKDTAARAAEATLSKLLGGLPLSEFLSEYFEKKPLHVRNDGSHQLFDKKLFSRKRLLKKVLAKHELAFGRDLAVCRYVDGERENYDGSESNGHATSGAVGSLLDRSYSCQFFQPQRYVDGLFALNSAFETVFGGLAGASAYLTPPNSQALAPHHDDVEVFILQTQGRKKWKLYKPLVELAGEYSADLSTDEIGEPWMELTLEEGDVLYFPRGVVHQAATDETQFSTHVTISVYQHNSWANFLEVVLPRIVRAAFDSDVEFRRGLPIGYLNYLGTQFESDSDKAKAFEKILRKLLNKLSGSVTMEAVHAAADEAAMDVMANRLPPAQAATNSLLDESASPLDDDVAIRFRHRSHIRLCLGTNDDDKEPFVALYYSTQNCRVHHMGLCTCGGDGDDKEDGHESEESDEDGGSNANESGNEDGDESGEDEEGDDMDLEAAAGGMPPVPKSVVFPGELASSLLKLYASTVGDGATVEELVQAGGDETAVRGMLLRLWSEELLDVTPRSS